MVDGVDDLTVQVVKLFEVSQFGLGLLQRWVFLALKSEQLLTLPVDREFLLTHRVLFVESLEPLDSLLGANTFHHWTILFVVSSEFGNILDQILNLCLQAFQVFGLFNTELPAQFLCLLNERIPVTPEHAPGVHFVLVHNATRLVIIQQRVHLKDRVETDIDYSL